MIDIDIGKMSNEELVKLYQQTTNILDKEFTLQVILNRMEGIMTQLCNYYMIPNTEFEDKMLELQVEMVKVLEKFDLQRQYKLTTVCRKYFLRCLNHLNINQTAQKRYNADIKHESFEELVSLHKDDTSDAVIFKSIYNEYEDIDIYETLKQIELTDKEYNICSLIMESDLAKSEVAKELSISHTMVNKYLKKIKIKLETSGAI